MRWLVLTVAVGLPAVAGAQQPLTDPGWPREFKQGRAKLTVYQPQLVEWAGYTNATIRCAIALVPSSDTKETFGVLELTADTLVDQTARTVTTINGHREIRFPNLPEAKAAELAVIVNNLLPARRSLVISLDRLLAYLDSAQAKPRSVDVNLQPPKIFYSRQPAILVMFQGQPQFKPVTTNDASFLFAANTNWDVFFDTANGRYYLLNDEGWLTSDDPLKGSWTPTRDLPKQLTRLPMDDNWSDVEKHIPGKLAKSAPVVFVSTEPAEMIITEGEPAFLPVKGTKLLQVSNTDAMLFLHSGEGQFYYLVAGRWFRAKTLDGPWVAASTDLPADFLVIPDELPAAVVKPTVPGTREAQDAVLLASIPVATTVDVTKPVAVKVVYEGAPQFVVIQGTTVRYAINSPYQVFLVADTYYCCNQGVWFYGPSATGPWLYASTVPAAIYTIPPTHPYYNVTYVTCYPSSSTTVVYTQTSGYSGEYVAATGVVMFGMGVLVGAAIADDDIHVHYWRYPPICHYSYGCGAHYHHGYGGYYGACHHYGPYGGAGRVATYNPHTGTYTRDAYVYGPRGSASVRQAYNPYTDTYAARATRNTPYGSSSRFYAERGNKEVWGGRESGARGTVSWAQTDKGAKVVAADTRKGQGVVAKDKDGNLYVGHDGNIYKRNDDGQWKSYEDGDWKKIESPKPDRPQNQPANLHRDLERDAQARSWGDRQAARTSTFERTGGFRRR